METFNRHTVVSGKPAMKSTALSRSHFMLQIHERFQSSSTIVER